MALFTKNLYRKIFISSPGIFGRPDRMQTDKSHVMKSEEYYRV